MPTGALFFPQLTSDINQNVNRAFAPICLARAISNALRRLIGPSNEYGQEPLYANFSVTGLEKLSANRLKYRRPGCFSPIYTSQRLKALLRSNML